ncbi:MAG: DUF3472 domain-containing protein [Verrucomicrobiales bacterium]|nr:DUF3472 domain-containing protein [Verrucomicrobiales bacterium]
MLVRALLVLGVTLAFVVDAAEIRAARSVHLGYPAPEGRLFYNEMVIEESVNGSYFMACGWNTGYFGLQQLDRPDQKVVIFSVWDPSKGDDPSAVKTEDRVELLHEGEGVRIRRFGGEGTGGQCMAPFAWTVGGTNRFLLRGEVQGTKTAYTAWVGRPDGSGWWKLATFRTRTGGSPLSGYYSFVEDFRRDGTSAREARRARFGNGWVRTTQSDWISLTRARFTASGAEWEAKDTINAGQLNGWFFLQTGGDTRQQQALKSVMERAPWGVALPDLSATADP